MFVFLSYLHTYLTKEEKLAGEKIRGQGQPAVKGNAEPPLSLSKCHLLPETSQFRTKTSFLRTLRDVPLYSIKQL